MDQRSAEQKSRDVIHDREREEYAGITVETVDEQEAHPRFDELMTPFEIAVTEEVGASPAGKRILDLGCGSGRITRRLLSMGADQLTSLDLSPDLLAVARIKADQAYPGNSVEWVAAPAETTGLPDASFDFIVGKWIIHHLDVTEAAAEIHRLLKPGGAATFIETSGLNPFLMFARALIAGRFGVPRVGTPDEHPLTRSDIREFAKPFARSRVDHPNFYFLMQFDGFVTKFRWPWFSKFCVVADGLIDRVPFLRFLSYSVRVTVWK